MLRYNKEQISTQQFNNAKQNLIEVARQYNQQMDTRKGSILSQLVIRPLAYIYSYMYRFISRFISQTSIATLLNNTSTATQTADIIASNYFVTRKQGQYATVSVYVQSSTATLIIRPTVQFSIQGTKFSTDKMLVCTPQSVADTETTRYITMHRIGALYYCIIPLTAIEPGYIQLLKQSTVTCDSIVAGMRSLRLLGDTSSGSQRQSDAALLQRARQSVQTKAQSTSMAIRQRMLQAPVTVLDVCSVAPQYGVNRSTYNTALVATSSTIDTFVRTAVMSQYSVVSVTAALRNGVCCLQLREQSGTEYAGVLRVVSVVAQSGGSITQYSTIYQSDDASVPASAARLSVLQHIAIYSDQLIAGSVYNVQVQYMPGVYQLQQYVNKQRVSFIGQSILVRAAIPVQIRLTVGVHPQQTLSDASKQQLQKVIAAYINSLPVGTTKLSLDMVRRFIQQRYTGIQLQLPCLWSASMLTPQQHPYTFSAVSGVLDIAQHKDNYKWDSLGTFLQCRYTDIILQVQ